MDKTAEEILLTCIPKDCYWEDMGNLTNCPKRYVISAMESYAISRTADLTRQLEEAKKEVERLKEWKYCNINQFPPDNLDVLVSDGKEVWIGDYNRNRSERDGKWAIVYNGAPPFDSTEIIMWKFKPSLP